MEYILLSSLCVVIIGLLIFVLIKLSKNKGSNNTALDDYKIEQLKKSLEEQNSSLSDQKELLNDKLSKQQLEVMTQFHKLSEELNKKINDFNEGLHQKMDGNAKTTNEDMKKLVENAAKLETQALELKQFSVKIEDLEKILNNNKTKGAFGEYQLEQILYNTFGENKKLYDTQYMLDVKGSKDNKLVPDAVIFLPNEIVCIDSKFPLDAYKQYLSNKDEEKVPEILKKFQQDVELKIKEVSKYIIQGYTSEYAVMFVPSDGIVSLLHEKCQSTIEKAQNAKVIITSPSTIIPLISSIKIVKNEYERNEKLEEIEESIRKLVKDFGTFTTKWNKVFNQLDTVYNSSEELNKTVVRMNRSLDKIKESDTEEDEKHEEIY